MSPQNDPVSTQSLTIRRVKRVGLAILGIAVLIVANGVFVRLQASNDVKAFAAEQSVPSVIVVSPKASVEGNTLTLPGTVQAYYSAPIYARVSGYVRSWKMDIGAPVRRGEVLAEIDIPEIDQQIAQARADLANAQASRQVSKSTAERWANLYKIQAVSKQDAEEKEGDLAVKTAQVNSSQANLDRLLTMQTFARITAPFDGIVTERNVDIGTLVNAGAGTAGTPLFTVADTHKMRVYVRVPQNYSAQIHDRMMGSLSLPEYPGESFAAELVSTSSAISNQSNTLLIQLTADNKEGKLKAGSYAQVTLQLPVSTQTLSIPVSALLFRADGLRVATVGKDDHVVMKTIKIAADLGTTVEVNAGLSATDKVIENPPDSLQSGDPVRVVDAANPAKDSP
jgi:RND family efflux transporter MFP subunit